MMPNKTAITAPGDINPHGSFTYDPQRAIDQGYKDGYAYALTWTFGKPVPTHVNSTVARGHKYNAEYVQGYVQGLDDGIGSRDAATQTQWASAYSHLKSGSRQASVETVPDSLWECPMCWTVYDPEEESFLDANDPVCPACHLELNTVAHRKTAAGPVFREGRYCDPNEIARQIGTMNIMAISGGRVDVVTDSTGEPTGINLPVSYGYSVVVYLDWNDTYVVQRCHNGNVKGEVTDVYFDFVGEQAYQASSYQSNEFGGHVKGGSRNLTRKKNKMSNRRNPARRRRMASEMNRNLMELDQTPSAQDWWGEHGGETGHGAANVANVPTPGAANSYPQPTNTDQDSAIGENAAEEWDGQNSIDKDDDMNIDLKKVEAFQRRVLANLRREAALHEAAFSDVRSKAREIFVSGGVNVDYMDPDTVVATVSSTSGSSYNAEIVFRDGSRAIEVWVCSCPWNQFRNQGNGYGSDGLHKYEGRMCSHALATYYEWCSAKGYAVEDPAGLETTSRRRQATRPARRPARRPTQRMARRGRPVAPKQARRRAR